MDTLRLPPLPSHVRALADGDLHRLLDSDPYLPRSPEQCTTCLGTKTFLWWADAQRTEVGTYECPCVDQWIAQMFFEHCGLQRVWQRSGWMDASGVSQPTLEAVGAYVDDMALAQQYGSGLILTGGSGSGKSLLAVLALKRFLASGVHGHFSDFQSIINTFTASWRDPVEKRWYHQRIRNVPVLAIDGLRFAETGKSGWLRDRTLEEVLRSRVTGGKVTIVTTAMSVSEMETLPMFETLLAVNQVVHCGKSAFWDEKTSRDKRERDLRLTRPVVFG